MSTELRDGWIDYRRRRAKRRKQQRADAAKKRAEKRLHAALASDELLSSPLTPGGNATAVERLEVAVQAASASGVKASLVTEAEYTLRRARSIGSLARRRDATETKLKSLLEEGGGRGGGGGGRRGG